MSKYMYIAPVLITLVAGCSTSSSDIEEFIKNPGVKPGRVEPLPKVKVFPTTKYDRSILSDPFSQRSFSVVNGKGAPDLNRPRELLEKFGLESLTMVGYLEQDKISYALVKDPEGSVHRVKVGNHLGSNFGKITAITKNGIELTENIADNTGVWSTREANLYYSEQEQLKTSGLSGKTNTAK